MDTGTTTTVEKLLAIAHGDTWFYARLNEALGPGWSLDHARKVRVEFAGADREFTRATIEWA